MVTTRKDAKKAFDHVLDDVLDRNDSSNLKKALVLAGITDISSLVTLEEDVICDLYYDDTTGAVISVNKGDKMLLKAFLVFVTRDDFVSDFNDITKDDFNEFRISKAYRGMIASPGLPPKSSTTKPAPPTHPSFSAADQFRRGIKRDPTLFPTLKDEKFHDMWHRSFVNQARAQDLSDVLDPSYTPLTVESISLFEEKQKYMYAVLEMKVLSDRGKAIIREHEDDFNAQAVYRKLKDHHLNSTKAKIESSVILSYITSSRLTDGSWKGSTESFITNWQNQVRLYEKHVHPTDFFSSGQKLSMLQNAVHGIVELRQVKNTSDLISTAAGHPIMYDDYVSLLLSAAASYDQQFSMKQAKRRVFSHHINEAISDDEDDVEDEAQFDIDYPVSSIQAYASNFRKRSTTPFRPNNSTVQLPREKWFALDSKNRLIWNQLDDKSKTIILDSSTPTVPHAQYQPRPNTFAKKPPRLHAHLHELSAYDFLMANMHNMNTHEDDVIDDTYVDTPNDTHADEHNDTRLINAAKSSGIDRLPPGDVRRVMSKSSKRSVNVVEYKVSYHKASSNRHLSLIDRGANGGVAGEDVRVIFKSSRTVDIKGIDNHHVNDICIGTVGGVVETQHGPIIIIMHQYALLGKGSSIHSPCQLEWYKSDVNDKSLLVPGGLQRIKTLEGHIIPLVFKDGLARLDIRPFTDNEFESLPHIFLTSELDWDPTVLDHAYPSDTQWGESPDQNDLVINKAFDEYGNYRDRVINTHEQESTSIDDIIDICVENTTSPNTYKIVINVTEMSPLDTQRAVDIDKLPLEPIVINKKNPDWSQLRPLFGWFSSDVIRKTFEHSTQYARLPTGTTLKKAFRSPNPALNVNRRIESVACDIVYADVPAVNDGSIAAVIFVGTDTQVTDVYGIKTDKQFVNTLEDNIIQRGAPNKLISDSAQVIIGNKVQDILRTLCIKQWQSEPYQQHQNAAERRYQTVKRATNRLLDRTGAPANTWLLCLQYVCYLLNHTYNENVNGIPLNQLTGVTVDISVLLRFHFWQKVYYKSVECTFPSDSTESFGHIVGIAVHCGHALTYKILNPTTSKVINRSLIRPYCTSDLNLRADLVGGESLFSSNVIKSRFDNESPTECANQFNPTESEVLNIPIINPDDLIGRSFKFGKPIASKQSMARVVRLIEDFDSDLEDNKTRIKFLLNIDNDTSEEIITYNQLLEYLSNEENENPVWKFKRIISHHGPLGKSHTEYKGSSYNLTIEWENGETTLEPLQIIASDDPVTCAIYAQDNSLLETPGWKQFKSIAKRQKNFITTANQVKLRTFNLAPKYKYGFEIPRTYDQAMRIDARNKNTSWYDAIDLELNQIDEYNTFKDHGHHTKTMSPTSHKKIRVHFVFDVKHDGRHKARLVADGHLTDIPIDSVYSGVVSLRGFRLVMFLAELNGLKLWATDIGNAYLEAFTSEKVFIIGGPEFKQREGHILTIDKALYGLRSSGARWHDRFSDCVSELGFFSCKAEPDIWMRKEGDVYEYIAVYVDDLALAMKNPKAFVDILQNVHNFKTKGTGPIKYHLGMDFTRDDDGTLNISQAKYIEKLISNYERLFGESPKQNVTSPLEKGDHPETDISDLLDDKGIQMYQSLIGALQWLVTIGRLDINTAVMTLSGFRVAPRKGHLDRIKRVYSYVTKMRHSAIRVRVEEPDYSDLPIPNHDWSRSVYGECKEILPHDAPEALGKHVTLTHYVDANLMHDITTGRSVTGILHLVNKTPIDWYSKKQATVETATYGSEFVAARICVEQVIDLRNTLRYLGVPIRTMSYMFGDNKSVVDSSMSTHAKLHKRHNILSFHRVRECIASGMIGFFFIPGDLNPADILSKHWGYSQIWPQLKALLFWKGDTGSTED